MAHELPAKLRLTMALLGCDTRKELSGRFREVNPRTAFDVERSHKWLQGRAKPRTGQVYDDWARVLGTERSGAWLAACTLDAFLDEVCARFSADRDDLTRRASLPAETGSAATGAAHYLCGHFAAYSHAWSPYFSGRLIRGSLLIQPGRGARFPVLYHESIPAGPVALRGTLTLVGRMLHAELRDGGSGAPLYITAFVPGRPANVLCGVMSGATFMSPDPEPSATRIAFVRVPIASVTQLASSNRYLPCDAGTMGEDLAALGLDASLRGTAASELTQFLTVSGRPGMTQIGQAEQARLASLFDGSGLHAR